MPHEDVSLGSLLQKRSKRKPEPRPTAHGARRLYSAAPHTPARLRTTQRHTHTPSGPLNVVSQPFRVSAAAILSKNGADALHAAATRPHRPSSDRTPFPPPDHGPCARAAGAGPSSTPSKARDSTAGDTILPSVQLRKQLQVSSPPPGSQDSKSHQSDSRIDIL